MVVGDGRRPKFFVVAFKVIPLITFMIPMALGRTLLPAEAHNFGLTKAPALQDLDPTLHPVDWDS